MTACRTAAALVALLPLAAAGVSVGEQESGKPRDVGLTERAGRRLAQFDPGSLDAVPRRAPASYLFNFDQHHLVPAGRQEGIDTARALISRLITMPSTVGALN